MWLYKNPQAFSSQSWQRSFSNILFCPESIFAVCQDGSLTVFLTASQKNGRRFYPTELLSRETPFWLWARTGFPPQGNFLDYNFYRAMHFSAKRGIAIACRLSVCLSVTLVNCDHIGCTSSKIISPLVSLGRSLFATPTWRVCSKGNTPKFSPEWGWGAEKAAFGVQKL